MAADIELAAACPCRPATGPLPQAPTIAIVDSGIDATQVADFGSRIVASVNVSSRAPGATGDQQGHGTMVAGVAAGGIRAPSRRRAERDSSSTSARRTANGESLASDVIAGIDWILAHKAAVRHPRRRTSRWPETTQTSFLSDPLDKAVEKLWFNGIVVVAAAGNHGAGTGEVDMSATRPGTTRS